MTLNRMQLSSSSGGSPVNYTFASNPREYDPKDEAYVSSLQVLHGSAIYQKRSWDDRPRILKWTSNEVTSSYISGLVTYFRSIEGQIRYFNFRDLDSINYRWPSSSAWKKARVVNVRTNPREGGSLKYEYVEIWIVPEQ